MKIQYCSDLHLEFPENASFIKNNPLKPLGDVLILAGDIIYLEERFFNHVFFDYCSANFETTYMICGNHEFYNGSDVSLYQKPICKGIRKNVFIVNNIEIAIKDVNFIFSTLWSKIDYKNSSLNDAFVIDLSNFIFDNNIDYWIYGHTHRNVIEVEINGTKLITNQLGYVYMKEQKYFGNNAVVDFN